MKQINHDEDQKRRFTLKDLAIVILSAVALVLLIVIIVVSRKQDAIISQQLQEDSQNVSNVVEESDDAKEKPRKDKGELIFTEANGDKWLELYNKSKEEIDITGYSIILSGNKVGEIIEKTIIGPEEYITIDIDSNPGEKVNNVISIIDKNSNEVMSFMIPLLGKGQSYGRRSLESYDMGYVANSKGVANENPDDYSMVFYSGIGYSVPSGFYDSSFELALSPGKNGKIYYTTDGTKPTTESQLYTEPIEIKKMSGSGYVYAKKAFGYEAGTDYYPSSIDRGYVVRAIKVDSSGKVIAEASQSYFVGLNYDSAYLNIPILSVTTDPENFFDYFDGLYVSGRTKEDGLAQGQKGLGNFLNGWVRNAKVEYYEPQKGKTFEAATHVSILADNFMYSRQKGFNFTLLSEDNSPFLGSSILNFIGSSNSFMLNNGHNDYKVRVRDPFVNELMEDSKVATADTMPCIVFIDGEYWGMYMMRARYDAKYFETHYGFKQNEIYIYNANDYSPQFQEFYDYVINNDMQDKEAYETVKKMMDVESYMQFFCVNMFMANSEYSLRRYYAWRTREAKGNGYDDARWRWAMPEMDFTLDSSNFSTYSIDTCLQKSVTNDPFLQSLLMNEEFSKDLVKTMQTMINERFSSENWETRLNDLASLLMKPSIATYLRFNGALNENWYMEQIKGIASFMENRPEYVMRYIQEVSEKGGDQEIINSARAGTLPDEEENEEAEETLENEETAEETTEDNSEQ